MKKFMNFRFMLIIAMSLLFSSALATYVFISQKSRFILCLVFLFIFVLVTIASVFLRRKFLYLMATIFLFIALPFANIFARESKVNHLSVYNEKEIVVYGRISEHFSFTSGGSVKIILDNISIYEGDESERVNGKIVIYTNKTGLDVTKLDIGRYILVCGEFDFNHYINDSYDIYYLNNDIIASGFVYNSGITFTDTVKTELRDDIKSKIYGLITSSGTKHSDVGFAMLFGDAGIIDLNTQNVFRGTGVAHLLAVSGFNTAIIIMFLGFILKKCKSPKWLEILIESLALLFYCYLCNFSVSVVRASLMAVAMLYSSARGKAYDSLSVLSLVTVIVLLINPAEMFNISFILSFSAVLSIILLMKPISRMLSKIFHKTFADVIALNLAVQLGLFVTTIYYFKSINLLGIICNLISVPIATLAFEILLIGTLFSLILPFMSFVLTAYGFLMDIMVKFNVFILSLNTTMIFENISVIYIALVFVFEFLFSDYVFAKGETKVKLALLALSVCNLISVLL